MVSGYSMKLIYVMKDLSNVEHNVTNNEQLFSSKLSRLCLIVSNFKLNLRSQLSLDKL